MDVLTELRTGRKDGRPFKPVTIAQPTQNVFWLPGLLPVRDGN